MRALLFVLKCLVGFFATVGLLTVVLLFVLGHLASRFGGLEDVALEAEVPAQAVLTLDLASGVVEAKPDNPLSRASLGGALVLRDTLDALAAGAADDRVKGLVARLGRGPLDMAQIQELRDAVQAFGQSGKFTIAFAESFGEGGNGTLHYYLASAFDTVWLQPSGDLDLTGISLQSPYLKQALAEYGIEPQVAAREEFKGAMSFLTEESQPEPQRRNLQRLVDSWVSQIASGIAAAREIEPARARALIDRGPYMAEAAREAGLVDQLGYWDQLDLQLTGQIGDRPDYLDVADYDRARDKPDQDGGTVALIYGLGPVQLAQSDDDPAFGSMTMGSDTVAAALSDAIEDPDVEAILFRVDSPGGSYVAADTIWREMQRAREAGKPVIVSMGGVAASGGYFVAAPAHRIVAQPGTVTGSIGVVAGKVSVAGLWDRLGISWDGVQAGRNAEIWSVNEPFDEAGWRLLNERLDATYRDFTSKVADGRRLSAEQVQAAAGGQVWTGEDALGHGLVDALGGYRTAMALAGEALGKDAETLALTVFPERREPLKALLEDAFGVAIEGSGGGSLVRALGRLLRLAAPFVEAAERMSADPRSQTLRSEVR